MSTLIECGASPFIPGGCAQGCSSGKWSDGKSGYRRQRFTFGTATWASAESYNMAESRTDIGAKSYSHFAGFAWLWRQR